MGLASGFLASIGRRGLSAAPGAEQEHLRYHQMTRSDLLNAEYTLRKAVASRRDAIQHVESLPRDAAGRAFLPEKRRDLRYYETALRLWHAEMASRGLAPQMPDFTYRGSDSRLPGV